MPMRSPGLIPRILASNAPIFRGLVRVLLLVAAMACGSCDTGSRSPFAALNPPPDPCSEEASPDLVGDAPERVCAGETFRVDIVNARGGFGLASYSAIFRDADDPETQIHGVVVSEETAFSDVFECDLTRIQIVAPAGVPDGLLEVVVERSNGEFLSAGTRPMRGCPEVIGFHSGVPGSPSKDPAIDFILGIGQPDAIDNALTLFGRNLVRSTSATLSDGAVLGPFTVTPQTVFSDLARVESVRVDVSGTSPFENLALPVGSTHPYVAARLQENISGPLVESNPVLVPLRQQFLGSAFLDLPGTITAAFVRPGIHRGDVAIEFVLAASPATATFLVRPEYFDPGTATWQPCTPAPYSELEFDASYPSEQSTLPFVTSGGALHTFVWDSVADVTGDPTAIRLRIPLDPPLDLGPVTNSLPTTTLPNGWFELAPVVLANPVTPEGLVTGFGGSLDETFDTLYRRDPDGTTAAWASSDGGLTSTPGETYFGVGTADLRLEQGREYYVDTNAAVIRDREAGTTDTYDLFFPSANETNPGATRFEFHVRTLVIESGALLLVRGDNPFVVRASGTGDNDEVVVDIGSVLLPLRTPVTRFFEGNAGGGDGGLAARVESSQTNGRFDVEPPTGGRNGGGRAGTSRLTDYPAGGIVVGGPGGGGGHFMAGGDGELAFAPPNSRFSGRPGSGGPRRGAPLGLRVSGGSGGGGGGAASRLGVDLRGGLGGAGGGSFGLYAAGAVEFGGIIDARGHNGGDAPMGFQDTHPGPGGGGSGGHVLFAALGRVELDPTATFFVDGGLGGSQPVLNGEIRGGDGSPGRVEFFAEGEFMVGADSNAGILPPISAGDLGIVLGSDAFTASGVGGPGGPTLLLDMSSTFDGNGNPIDNYTFDTDAGELRDPVGALIHTASSTSNEFEFDSLTIATGVYCRARGSQPLVLRCSGTFTLDGVIDVSGRDGGLPTIDSNGALVRAAGGVGGPGAGLGGLGGDDVEDGGNADLGFILASPLGGMDPTTPPDAVAIPGGIITAFGGETGTDRAASMQSAGGGGGGGFRDVGGTGSDVGSTLTNGAGGSAYGSTLFSFVDSNTGEIVAVRLGGMGGAGGGGFVETTDAMGFVRPREFGTAGGGGGGYVQISSNGLLTISAGGEIIARGGDAFAARGAGGNGGAGAGGTVFLQSNVQVNFTGTIDLRGGTANRTEGLPYSANVNANGGDGSPGRLRIEAPNGFAVLFDQLASTAQFSSSVQVADRRISVGRLQPVPLVATDGARLPLRWEFDPATISLPGGVGLDRVAILYDVAYESDIEPGRPGEFFGPFLTPNDFPDGAAFARPEVHLLPRTSESLNVRRVSLPFRSVDPAP